MQFIMAAHDTDHQTLSINHLQQTDGTELFFSWAETRKSFIRSQMHPDFIPPNKILQSLKLTTLQVTGLIIEYSEGIFSDAIHTHES